MRPHRSETVDPPTPRRGGSRSVAFADPVLASTVQVDPRRKSSRLCGRKCRWGRYEEQKCWSLNTFRNMVGHTQKISSTHHLRA